MTKRAWGPVFAWARGAITQRTLARSMKRSPTWLCSHELGRRRVSADELVDLHAMMLRTEGTKVHRFGLTLQDLVWLADEVAAWKPELAPALYRLDEWIETTRAEFITNLVLVRVAQRAEEAPPRLFAGVNLSETSETALRVGAGLTGTPEAQRWIAGLLDVGEGT